MNSFSEMTLDQLQAELDAQSVVYSSGTDTAEMNEANMKIALIMSELRSRGADRVKYFADRGDYMGIYMSGIDNVNTPAPDRHNHFALRCRLCQIGQEYAESLKREVPDIVIVDYPSLITTK
jgi:hypothetical protein